MVKVPLHRTQPSSSVFCPSGPPCPSEGEQPVCWHLSLSGAAQGLEPVSRDVFLMDQGKILNLVNPPILNTLTLPIRSLHATQMWQNAGVAVCHDRSTRARCAGTRLWRGCGEPQWEVTLRAIGGTRRDRMSNFIPGRRLPQLMPRTQRLLNYLWRVTGSPECFSHCLFSSKSAWSLCGWPYCRHRKPGLCKQGTALSNYRSQVWNQPGGPGLQAGILAVQNKGALNKQTSSLHTTSWKRRTWKRGAGTFINSFLRRKRS